MHRVDFFDYTVPEPAHHPPTSTKGSYVAIMFFVAVVVIAALAFLREPIHNATSAEADRVRIQLEERRQRAEQEALKQAIEPRITMAIARLETLETAMGELAVQFQQTTAVPLDRAHETATRKIDYLILDSDTFAAAWHRMKHARVSADELQRQKNALADIRYSLQNSRLDPIHISQLDALLVWIDGQGPLLETQRECLQTMQNELAGLRPAPKGGMWQCL